MCKTVESRICDRDGTKRRISGGTGVLLRAIYESKNIPTPRDFEEGIMCRELDGMKSTLQVCDGWKRSGEGGRSGDRRSGGGLRSGEGLGDRSLARGRTGKMGWVQVSSVGRSPGRPVGSVLELLGRRGRRNNKARLVVKSTCHGSDLVVEVRMTRILARL